MSNLPSISIDTLPEEFFIDVAVGVHTYVEICDTYNIDETTAETIKNDPMFIRRLRVAEKAVEDDGSAFRARCRTAVSEGIRTVVHMMKDPEVAASVQLDAFKTLVKYGGLEPSKVEDANAGAPSLVLNIVAPDGSQFSSALSTPIDVTPTSTITSTPSLDIVEPEDVYDELDPVVFEVIE